MFQLLRNVSKQNWNKPWKRWKYRSPFLVFRNTETMDYIGKKLKRTETGRKLTKSKRFSCFETKLKQALQKVKIPGPISGVSKHWNNGLYREKIETGLKQEENWLSPNVSVSSKQNWNKLWKRRKYQAPFLVFRNTETMDYIEKKFKRTETGRKLTKSKRFSCFKTKLKQAVEKVKIPGPISGVSKHWHNGLYREIIETNWNRKKTD